MAQLLREHQETVHRQEVLGRAGMRGPGWDQPLWEFIGDGLYLCVREAPSLLALRGHRLTQ